MDAAHISKETIEKEVGRWNTDIALGWETGLKGKERIGGKLRHRQAPEHFHDAPNINRLLDWELGYEKALEYRSFQLNRSIHFVGKNAEGEVLIVRKGWSAKRGKIVAMLEQKGCYGDVRAFYFESSRLVRTVTCGI